MNKALLPDRLFRETPILNLVPHERFCGRCNGELTVLKTRWRRDLYTLDVGRFHAHITQLECKSCRVIYSNDELNEIVQSHCRFGFDVLVYAGKSLFVECVNENEIRKRLKEKNISISRREIGELGKKFVICLSLVHQACGAELKQFMSAQGGYILHLDGTVEGDSPHLMTGIDEITGIVLNNSKIPSENTADIIPFLETMKELYGLPAGIVRDMGVGISSAIKVVFPSVPDFICHFHFLRDLGKDLFEYEHSRICHLLRGHSTKTVLRSAKKECGHLLSENPTLAIELKEYLQQNQEGIPNTCLSAEVRFYIMIIWALEYKRELNGLGFPFDRQHLVFYQRLKEVAPLIESLKENFVKKSAFSQVFLNLKKIMKDSDLKTMVTQIEEKVEVFDQLREAMRIAQPHTTKGLNDEGDGDLRTIEKRVTQFRKSEKIVQLAKENKDYQKMLKQIDKYWDKLFADPIEVATPHGKMTIQPQRTNNMMEQFFREEKRRGRKKSGTSSLSRSFKAMVADTPLVRNLENPQYMEILLKGKQNLEQRFAQIDAQQVRENMKKHEEEWRDLPKGIRRMLKMPDLPQKLFQQVTKTTDGSPKSNRLLPS